MVQMDASEKELLIDARAGNESALGRLLESHATAIRQSIAGRIPAHFRPVLSEDDVLQQTFADAFRDIDRFEDRGEGAFSAWLSSLARCNLQDALKMLQAQKRGGNRRRVQPQSDDLSDEFLLEVLCRTDTTPSRHAARDEARTILKARLAELPEDYRTVVEDYDLFGKTIEEVSERMNRSPGAVYMLRARAHDRLRRLMGDTSNFFTGGE